MSVTQLLHLSVTPYPTRQRRARAMRASLRVIHPEMLVRALPLERAAVVLGRREVAGLASLSHPTVSRRHVRLEWQRATGSHVVRDLGSHSGSRVNGLPLSPEVVVELAHGDVLQLGEVLAVYEIEPAEPIEDLVVSTDALPGQSVAMRRLRGAVARAARDPSPVLLVGEAGSGVEQVAGELHRLSGRAGELSTLDCAAFGPGELESRLFGQPRAPFAAESAESAGLLRAAAGGTVLLDHIGDLPLDLQARLLRALHEREVLPVGATRPVPIDVRIIAATDRDLGASVDAGGFRRDLYARLALWEIAVPPLRERRADLFALIGRFHRRWLAERGGQIDMAALELSPAAAEAVALCDWPDNLRGVSRLVQELAARGGRRTDVDELPAWLCHAPRPAPRAADPAAAPAPRTRVRRATPTPEELTAAMIERGGSVRAVARHYGRDRRQIYRWIEAYGLGEHRRGRR